MLVLEHTGQKFEQLLFSPNGRWVVAGSLTRVSWWDLHGPSQIQSVTVDGVRQMGFLPDGQLLVRVLGIGIREWQRELPGHHAIRIDLEHDRRTLIRLDDLAADWCFVPTSPTILQYAINGTIQAVELRKTGKLKTRWTTELKTCSALAISPIGSWFVITSPQSPPKTKLHLCSLDTGNELNTHTLSLALPQLVIAPNGELFASIYFNTIRHWNRQKPRQIVETITNASGRNFSAAVFHPSSRYLAATSDDHTVQLYDTTTWALVKTFTWEIGRLRSIAFSSDGTLAAAGSDSGQIIVWDFD